MAAYDRGPMDSVALDIGCPDDRTPQLDVRLYQGRQLSGAPPRLQRPHLAFMQAGQLYDSAIAYLFTTSRNLKRVPEAGSRNEWKTAIDAIPDDSELADTRTPEPDSNS